MLVRVGRAGRDDPDQPVVERAWTPATHPAATSVLALPAVGRPAVTGAVLVTNPGEEEVAVVVRPVRGDGTPPRTTEMTVPGLSTVPVDEDALAGAVAVSLTTPGAGIAASAVTTARAGDGELVTVLSGQPDLASEQHISVRLPRP
jgi:hypothetical protein